jgi:hypothetical protein
MKIIAHRGLLSGPNPELENHPDQIIEAISNGFDVEIDLRFIDNEWWLGHDKSQYKVEWNFIETHSNWLWIHAKDIATLHQLTVANERKALHYFFHDIDDCTLTSERFIWTFPGKLLTEQSIAVMPERVENWQGLENCFAICTDFAIEYRERFKNSK